MLNRKNTLVLFTLLSIFHNSGVSAECICGKVNDPNTPINQAILAMSSGNYDNSLAFKLLESEGDPNITNSCDAGLLLIASIYNDVKLTSELLLKGADPNIQNVDGLSPVYFASTWSSNDVLKLLLDAGGNPNVILKPCSIEEFNTPLLTAVLNDNMEGIKLLLRYGADFSQETVQGLNIFDFFMARELSINSIVEIASNISLKSDRDRALSILLFSAVASSKYDYLKGLLALGVTPDFIYMDDVKFNTPLLMAAILEDVDSVRLLINYGANINYVNPLGYSLKRIIDEKNIQELYYLFPDLNN